MKLSHLLLNSALALLVVQTMNAGQSVEYGTAGVYNQTIPLTPTNRVEQEICWALPVTGINHILGSTGGAFGFGAFGWAGNFQVGPPVGLSINNGWDNDLGVFINLTGVTNGGAGPFPYCALLRVQHDQANMLDDYEAWDLFGNRFFSQTVTFTVDNPSGAGFQLGNGSEPTAAVGFIRGLSTLVPLNSIPPTTFSNDASRLFEWKFEGNLNDSTGNGNTGIIFNGSSFTYIATPYQSPPISVVQDNATTYANVTSDRAGYSMTFNGSASYSQADTSAAVTYFWQQLSGPSQLVWPNGHTSATPLPIGSIWGDYPIQLTVTDVNGVTGVSQVDVGSVAQDSKGIVVNADPNADAVFGSMIAYGRNPWSFADQWEYNSMFLRCSVYGLSSGCVSPSVALTRFAGLQWEQTGAGTVSYVWGGVGNATPGQACANTLTGNITATQTTIPISNSACVDTSSLPTRIILGTSSPEEIRICSVTAGTPPAETLNVCYDGRGYLSTAASASSGTNIQQFKVTGSGTNFVTDSNAPVCPLGFPAPTGPSYYSTGTISLTAGSVNVVGSGTTFTSGMVGSYLVATATHSSTPYVLIRPISGFTDATHITLATAFPSDSDSGSYSYSITAGQRTLVLRGPMAIDTSATGLWMWNASGCESTTNLYVNPFTTGNEFASGHAAGFNTGTTYGGLPYSVTDTSGWIANTSQGGINFYGESGAWRKLWLRSGLTAAGNAANLIDNHLIHSPWGNIYGGGCFELICGGPGIMGFASAVLGAGSGPGAGQGPSWGDLRSYAKLGENNVVGIYNSGSIQCWQQDTRSNSYAEAWLVLAAIYDPNPTWKAEWVSDMALMQTVDTACHQSDYSWSQSSLWSTGGGQAFGPVTLTHNSTAVTGTFTLNGGGSACTGTAIGTGTVVNGSGTLTIASGTVSGDSIAVTGTMSSAPYTIQVMYSGSGSTIQIAGLWPGDTGSVTWMSVNTSGTANNLTSYGTDNNDTADLTQNYDCMVTGAGTAVLDHPWAGTTGSSYYGTLYVLSGYGQQAFYNGINAYRLRLLANSALPSASFYQGILNNTVAWIKNIGYNSTGLYVDYGSVFSFCAAASTLVTNPSASSALPQLSPGCNYPIQPANPQNLANNRAQNSELGIATSAYYAQNPTTPNKTWGDQTYGAVWGNPQYNIGGVYSDQYSSALASNIGATNLYLTSQAGDKWPGFYCGIGSCDEWPAYRLGGVDPTVTSDIYEPFTLSGITGAAKVNITVTAASGLAASTLCTSSPCHLTNIRQHTGWALIKIDYQNSGGTVIAPGVALPLYVP